MRPELRRAVIFGRHDLVQDAPISRVDLLACRNTLMYFNAETQRHILSRLHFATVEDGFLFLGKVEMLVHRTNLFSPAEVRMRIFRKDAENNLRDRLLVMAESQHHIHRTEGAAGLLAAGFENNPTASLIIDDQGILTHANGHARTTFNLAPGDVGRLFQDLEVSYRPVELRSHLKRAMTERTPVSISHARRDVVGGDPSYLDIHIVPLTGDGGASGWCAVDLPRRHPVPQSPERAGTCERPARQRIRGVAVGKRGA